MIRMQVATPRNRKKTVPRLTAMAARAVVDHADVQARARRQTDPSPASPAREKQVLAAQSARPPEIAAKHDRQRAPSPWRCRARPRACRTRTPWAQVGDEQQVERRAVALGRQRRHGLGVDQHQAENEQGATRARWPLCFPPRDLARRAPRRPRPRRPVAGNPAVRPGSSAHRPRYRSPATAPGCPRPVARVRAPLDRSGDGLLERRDPAGEDGSLRPKCEGAAPLRRASRGSSHQGSLPGRRATHQLGEG